MSTQSGNIVWSATTGLEFNNAVSAFSAALTAAGLLKSSDTGQLTPGSVSMPPGLPTGPVGNYSDIYGAYEIRTLTAVGLPTIYLRFDYGVSNVNGGSGTFSSYWRPVIKITSATATDGAGNLIGVVNPWGMQSVGCGIGASYNPAWFASAGSPHPSLVARPFYIATDGANYLTIVIDPTRQVANDCATSIMACAIERTITPGDGQYNGTGWAQYDMGGATAVGDNSDQHQYGYSITSIVSAFTVHTSTAVPAQTPGTLFSSSGGGNSCTIFPITVMTPQPQGPMTAAITYFTNDIIPGVQFNALMYGQPRVYMALGVNPINAKNCNPANSAIYSPALRYD